MRADLFLSQKLNISRNQASELIKNGKVKINFKEVNKASFEVLDENACFEVDEKIYVSRAALKLKAYLQDRTFPDFSVLDVGSSTGGFMQILLEKGAKKVVGVDVGEGQLSPILKENPKVESFEKSDIRTFSYPEKFDLVSVDISFISLLKVLPDILNFAKDKIIFLFKPQFEVGKEAKRDKNGVVKDAKAVKIAQTKFETAVCKAGFKLINFEASKVSGKEGNEEFFYEFERAK